MMEKGRKLAYAPRGLCSQGEGCGFRNEAESYDWALRGEMGKSRAGVMVAQPREHASCRCTVCLIMVNGMSILPQFRKKVLSGHLKA